MRESGEAESSVEAASPEAASGAQLAASRKIWGFFGVYGASIIVISFGGIISIIVSSNFGITIGGISDVLNCFLVMWAFLKY